MTEPTKPLKIVKPTKGFLEKFRSTQPAKIAGVETLLTALELKRIGEVGDWTRLHENEAEYWSPELCFVSVPIKDTKRDMLHVIEDEIAVKYLHAKKIKRQRLALAATPRGGFFLCIVPSRNLDLKWNETALEGCTKGKTQWVQANSRKEEGLEYYKIEIAPEQDAFDPPNWPSRTLEELLEVTFRGANIDTEDHPALLRLIGRKQTLT